MCEVGYPSGCTRLIIRPPRTMAMRVGLIGAGTMGSAMGRAMLRHGVDVVVYDLDPQKVASLVESGATAAKNSSVVAKLCPHIVMSLPGDAAVTAVVQELARSNSITPATVIVDTSTTTPECAEQQQRAAREHGATFVDAPVTGEEARAEQGELTMMIGAHVHETGAVIPILNHLAQHIFHMGEPGLDPNLTVLATFNLTLTPPLISAARAMLCLGCSMGRAQSCFLTIPRTLAASLTRLALHLSPGFYIP